MTAKKRSMTSALVDQNELGRSRVSWISVNTSGLIRLMWKASDASLAVYEPSDLSIAIKADQSPVTELI